MVWLVVEALCDMLPLFWGHGEVFHVGCTPVEFPDKLGDPFVGPVGENISARVNRRNLCQSRRVQTGGGIRRYPSQGAQKEGQSRSSRQGGRWAEKIG